MELPKTIVIDNGTGFTKMGYAGNSDPSHKFPTVISTSSAQPTNNKKFNEQLGKGLDFAEATGN